MEPSCDPLQLLRVDGLYSRRGRVESVPVGDRNVGTFSNFQQGAWAPAEVSAADTADGRINAQVDDARQGWNVVVSQARFEGIAHVPIDPTPYS